MRLLLACLLSTAGLNVLPADNTARWLKGNLHTHTLWSDGDDFPDMVADWYKRNGYDFLAISDHNILLEGEKYIRVTEQPAMQAALAKYRARFPENVKTIARGGQTGVRLATLAELKKQFEEPEKFLLIPSEEISAHHGNTPVHLNATNVRDLIKPLGGSNVLDVLQQNVNAVLEQRRRTGQAMFPHVNHPNFFLAVTPEELMRVRGERFFEVYNGHPLVLNEGDEKHPSTEKMWDIVLAWRLAVLKLEPMFGLAVDDSHNYHLNASTNSNPGRGWVMVRAASLAPESIVLAMEAGDFYASTGVRLKNVTRTAERLAVEIDGEPGVEYATTFVGTRKSFLREGATPPIRPEEIGRVLEAETRGTAASYDLKPEDLYVRAAIVSTKRKTNGLRPGETERAWTQPAIAKGYHHPGEVP